MLCLLVLLWGRAAAAQDLPAAGPVRLGVLPFRVESAKPVAYLGDSLANLVRHSFAKARRRIDLSH